MSGNGSSQGGSRFPTSPLLPLPQGANERDIPEKKEVAVVENTADGSCLGIYDGTQSTCLDEIDITGDSAEFVSSLDEGENTGQCRKQDLETIEVMDDSEVESAAQPEPNQLRIHDIIQPAEESSVPPKWWSMSAAVRREKCTGLFHGGLSGRHPFTAKQLAVHDVLEVSMPYLPTSNDGVLHVLPGWSASMVLQDLSHRYATCGSWGAQVPFVESDNMKNLYKRKYNCTGVKVCPLAPEKFRLATHSSQTEYEELRKNAENLEVLPMHADKVAFERARSVYLALINKNGRYCHFRGRDPIFPGTIKICSGRPMIRTNRTTGEQFIGCSGYKANFKDCDQYAQGAARHHTSRTMRDLSDTGRKLLQEMINSGIVPVRDEEVCYYVAKKSSKKLTCPAHGLTLVSTGSCPNQMLLVEPEWQQTAVRPQDLTGTSGTARRKLLAFAMCRGVHNHPPPPPPVSTGKKAELLIHEALASADAPAAIIKLRTQLKLQHFSGATGNALQIDSDQLYSIIGAVRKATTIPEAKEAHALFSMVADPENDYVRDINSFDDGFVVLLGTDDMLRRALSSGVFAGDATYKIVNEANRLVRSSNWYLYNIVCRSHSAALGSPGLVVARFLMNRLTSGSYRCVWGLFFNSLRRLLGEALGLPTSLISVSVPYLPSPLSHDGYSVEIRSVTTDFDVSEVEGIALALEDVRGGSRDVHLSSMFVGCQVHFERDARRRCAKQPSHQRETLYNIMLAMKNASTVEDAEGYWEDISTMDPEWARWAKGRVLKSMVIPAYSGMSERDRSVAFKDTNCVESQNRRANYLCGTQLKPGIAAARLRDLDRVAIALAKNSNTVPEARFSKLRRRSLNIAAPLRSPSNAGRRKRKAISGVSNVKRVRNLGKEDLVSKAEVLSPSDDCTGQDGSSEDALQAIRDLLLEHLTCPKTPTEHCEKLVPLAIQVEGGESLQQVRVALLSAMSHSFQDETLLSILKELFRIATSVSKTSQQEKKNTTESDEIIPSHVDDESNGCEKD